nr:hypothetical protein [Bacteroidota bacterium]
MNQQKLMLCSILVSLMVISCKKDKTTETNPVITESTNYKFQLPLAIGNYWVYETVEVDSNGTAVPYGNLDSCYVSGDTLIGNKTYFKLYWKPLVFQATVSYARFGWLQC